MVEAVEACTTAIQCDPKCGVYRRVKGECLARLKKYKEAIEDLTEAINLDPADAKAYGARARMWAMIGDEGRWEADLKKAKELER